MKRTLKDLEQRRFVKAQEALKKKKLARTMATAVTIDTTQHSAKAKLGDTDRQKVAVTMMVEAQRRKLQEDRQKAAVIMLAAYRNAEELTGLDHGELLCVAAEVGTMRLRGQLA